MSFWSTRNNLPPDLSITFGRRTRLLLQHLDDSADLVARRAGSLQLLPGPFHGLRHSLFVEGPHT